MSNTPDLEVLFQAHPLMAVVFMLSSTFAAALGFAFLAQWNQLSMLERMAAGFMADRRHLGPMVAFMKWYLFGSFIVGVEIWKETRGMRVIVPVAVVCGIAAFVTYRIMLWL